MLIELGKEEGVGIKISTAGNYPRGREYSDENLFGTFVFPMTVRQWHPTPVLLPEKFHGQKSLAGYSPWGCKELNTTEQLSTESHLNIFFIN